MKREQANRGWLAWQSKSGTGNVLPHKYPEHSLAQFSPVQNPEEQHWERKGGGGKDYKAVIMKVHADKQGWLACRSTGGTGNVLPHQRPEHSLAQFLPLQSSANRRIG